MGYFANLAIEIQEARSMGATVDQIAEHFSVATEEVVYVLEMMEESDSD